MQIASSYEHTGLKLFLHNISKEKVNTIIKKLGNTEVLFFIDDFQSSLNALSILSKHKTFRYVVAERDYAYLSSSNHEFFSKDIEVIDVTEISNEDTHKIYEKIPQDIRKQRFSKTSKNDSLFELIEKNCIVPSIKSRFDNVVRQLKEIDIRLVDLFLLICYMHRSRSVASMDVLLAFFSGRLESYQEIYELIDTLGSSIRDYTDTTLENNQDYFDIRSNMLADVMTERAPVKNLSDMLRDFHNKVSKDSIPNYDVFKRRAYDARMFEKAFSDIDDGCGVYDVIYKKHPSPFNLQQKALFLSRRGHHGPAFSVIDEAVAKVGSKNWSIKNSYAIIMFKANIKRSDSNEVKDALDESMKMLSTCYSSDSRKTFHAMTYTDHALRYWKKYRDQTSYSYLIQAKEWLEEESRSSRRMANVRRLLRECNQALRTFG